VEYPAYQFATWMPLACVTASFERVDYFFHPACFADSIRVRKLVDPPCQKGMFCALAWVLSIEHTEWRELSQSPSSPTYLLAKPERLD
jgi:hypothetical protein